MKLKWHWQEFLARLIGQQTRILSTAIAFYFWQHSISGAIFVWGTLITLEQL